MKRSILIVDDEFGLADLVADLLAREGYDVAIAINGRLGLQSLATRHADLVLADVMMPLMGGPEMVAVMRATPELAAIPVILMTAMPEVVPKGPDALHDGLLVKPFRRERLLELIRQLLGEPP
jgi:CheY-like chemotaxis protein